MARIKQRIARLMPPSVVSSHSVRRETKALSRTPRLECDTRKLRLRSEIDLSELFDSHEIQTRWDQSSKKTEQLAIPERRGGLNVGDRRALYYLISSLNPSSVLEIGTHIGASTLHIASAMFMNRLRDGTPPQLISVDIADVNSPASKPWLVHGSSRSPRAMAEEMGYTKFVEFITDDSLSYFAECRQRFDVIFLDGDHAAATLYQEIPGALSVLNPNGVILLHDYFPQLTRLWPDVPMIPGPFLATERLEREGAKLVVLPLGSLPWRTKVQSNATSLALLLRRQ
jgi:predicted O-methyltransferase YrrM